MAGAAARSARLPRFFVTPDSFDGDGVRLRGSAAHQLRHVLRARSGERIVLLDGSGQEFEVVLDAVNAGACEGHIVAARACTSEPRVRLTLYAGLLKHDKFEWVLQKGVELGVAAFQPVLTERCVSGEVRSDKYERWQRIVREAAEQSERGLIPPLAVPLDFDAAAARAPRSGLSLIAHEEEHQRSLRATVREQPSAALVSLFIGPEGGFTPAEIELARSQGIIPVTLGPRILRAETASLAAAAAVLYEYGEMG